jgi:hypothetical protein
MLYGIECQNGFGESRDKVYFAENADEAMGKFNNEFDVIHNKWKATGQPCLITSNICEILYQSGREVVYSEELPFTIDNFRVKFNFKEFNGTSAFNIENLHFSNQPSGAKLVLMICIHTGKPNWLY